VPAAGAAVAVPAERGSAATLDGPDDFMLQPGDTGAAAIEEASDIGMEDIGHLQGGPAHEAAGSRSAAMAAGRLSSGLGATRSFRVERCR
jgi:hypothetical protein